MRFKRLRYAFAETAVLAGILSVQLYAVEPQDVRPHESRTVQLERWMPNDPVRVVRVMFGDVAVQPGVPFVAEGDWLQKVSIVIRNETQKKITAAVIHVDFPDTESAGHPRMGHQFTLGQRPEHAMYNRLGKRVSDLPREPFELLPGQEVAVSLGGQYEKIKGFIESRQPMQTVKTCWVRLLGFFFEDGTRWDVSHYARPDPDHPGRYIPITVQDFRGGSTSE
jgi:hypothetical protein